MKLNALLVILILSLIGNLAAGYLLYKTIRYRQVLAKYQDWLQKAEAKARLTEANLVSANPYAEDNRQLQTNPSHRPDVVFYGASITRGWNLDEFFSGQNFVNRGMGGKILPYLMLHFRDNVLELKPRFVVIKACAINITPEMPVETVQDCVRDMSELAVANGITPLLATMLPARREAEDYFPGFSVAEGIKQFNQWLVTFATDHKYTLVDYYTPLQDGQGFFQDSLSRDALHPSPEGYRVMADTFGKIWTTLASEHALTAKER